MLEVEKSELKNKQWAQAVSGRRSSLVETVWSHFLIPECVVDCSSFLRGEPPAPVASYEPQALVEATTHQDYTQVPL